jgi:cytochrome c-type biogenesis protein CcmE
VVSVFERRIVHSDNLKIRFDVSDGAREIAVAYQGVLPDLFREGQGVVARQAFETVLA